MAEQANLPVATGADRALRRLAYWLIVGLALILPTLSRPTNVIAAALLLVMAARLALGGRTALLRNLDVFDYCVAGLAAASLLSSAFGLSSLGGYQGLAEALSHLAVFVGIRHGGLDGGQLRRLALAVVVGTLIAAALGLGFHLLGGDPLVRLPAMPGTIRSSLYTGITLLLCVGLAITAEGWRRLLLLAAVVFLGLVLLSMTSRAVVITLAFTVLLGLAIRYQWRMFLPVAAIAAAMAALAVCTPESAIKARFEGKTAEMTELVAGVVSDNDQTRIEFWRVSLAWIGQGKHWLLGIGPRNFHLIDAEQLPLEAPLRFPEQTRYPSHAHNMYLTKYVEEGVLGLSALIALFALVAWRLVRDARAGRVDWPWWGALGGLLLPAINGIVGSPWFREYAWLAVATFALYLAVPAIRR